MEESKRKRALLKIKIAFWSAILLIFLFFGIIIAQTIIIKKLENQITNIPSYSSEATEVVE